MLMSTASDRSISFQAHRTLVGVCRTLVCVPPFSVSVRFQTNRGNARWWNTDREQGKTNKTYWTVCTRVGTSREYRWKAQILQHFFSASSSLIIISPTNFLSRFVYCLFVRSSDLDLLWLGHLPECPFHHQAHLLLGVRSGLYPFSVAISWSSIWMVELWLWSIRWGWCW